MRRIELMGPPGVGKTTILPRLLDPLIKAGHDLIDWKQLPLLAHLHRTRAGPFSRYFNTWMYTWRASHRWMRPKFEQKLRRHEFRRLREADAPWPAFLAHCLHNPGGHGVVPALQLDRMVRLTECIALARVADRLTGDSVVVFDESLTQRGLSLGEGTESEQVRQYFTYVPAPTVVIAMDAPTDILRKRLEQRNGPDHRHVRSVERNRELFAEGARVLSERGIRVVHLDGSDTGHEALATVVRQVDAGLTASAA